MKEMTSHEIRNMYLKYFESKGHSIIESASLIPVNDPTLLWINAGVTPLKRYFDGTIIPKNKRMTSSQKCIRTNDIENVGKTARHHTFFEMLGNFSVGDYFKKEAIDYTYELLTSKSYFGLDKDKLYMTIYPSDEETYNLWLNKGVEASHIIKLEDNFWEIGEGPCGPDSEIFYDRGENYDPDQKGLELLQQGIDNDRYVEIWNNVFSQFNSKEGLSRDDYPELPNKNIDTGMGLERITCIIQNTKTNFETDLFMPIIEKIEEISGKAYRGQMAFKVIADHIRALTFAISDGAVFSNEGRGYVLRRLLRRAVRFGKKLGINKPFMSFLVDAVVTIMQDDYPMVVNKASFVKTAILNEEELFHKTLASGEKRLNELMKDNSSKTISGEDAFKLYDTYGFPFELTLEYLEEKGFTVSKEQFDQYMQKQRDMARQARKNESSMNIQNENLLKYKKQSRFIGYDTLECETRVIGLMKNNEFVDELTDTGVVILDETPFYAESGGQIADIGGLKNEDCKVKVLDVQKAPHKQHLHIVEVVEGSLKINDAVYAKIDVKRRQQIAKNHSAAHLLQDALREVLDKDIAQAGSRIDNKTLRFDFTYTEGNIKDEDIVLVEKLVNDKIATKVDSITNIMSLEEAKEKGAIALFEDKYEDIVRVVTLYDSIELCGGTHVANVGDINRFAIKSIESKGSNVYRIEAATDINIEEELFKAIEPYNEEMIKLLNKAKRIETEAYDNGIHLTFDVSINNDKPTSYKDIISNCSEVANVRDKVKELEKEFNRQKQEKALNDLSSFDKLINKFNMGEYIITKIENYDMQTFKRLVDCLVEKLHEGFVFIANVSDNNVNFIAKCSKNIAEKIDCGALIKEISLKVNGNGGGAKWFAQGGGTNTETTDQILLEVKKKIENIQ